MGEIMQACCVGLVGDALPGELWPTIDRSENGDGDRLNIHVKPTGGELKVALRVYARDASGVARALAEELMRAADQWDATADDDRDGVAVPGDSHPILPPMAVAPYEYAEANCNHCLGGGLEIVDGDAVACRACGGLGAM